ncbi:MAG: cadherin-like domain-containing protein, partial [Ruminiclostridium sp.]|nr:cadherin-like domain-containing protein [Ruminiclostridium sp.]
MKKDFTNKLYDCFFSASRLQTTNRKKMTQKSSNIYIKSLLLVVAVVMGWTNVFAEGSKDLYPSGSYGGRATLRASETEQNYFPFPTYGTHYVYAKEGETIAIASSAQNNTTKRIYLINPSGTDVTPTGTGTNDSGPNATRGNISNRDAELAGPRLPGQVAGEDRYLPVYYTVPKDGAGIYKVEFGGTGTSDATNSPNNLKATDNWTQGANTYFIYAWDISVANSEKTEWIPGRVYMNVFNAQIANVNGSNWRGDEYNFYGKFVVHTRDGFMYEVDNNGNAGYRFTFMVNNKGFHAVGDTKTPSYQSISATTAAQVQARYRDPRIVDGNDTYTQKIFYNLPDATMPATANGAVPGGSIWLHVPQPQLDVSTAQFVGADGESNWAAGSKGGHFVFEAQVGLKYEIKISPSGGASFVERILTGYVQAENIGTDGKTRVYWDGKGGNGQPLPNGVSPGGVTLQLQGAEVHFPFIDMEVNPNGLKLQFYNPARNGFISDKVYWDDTAIGNGGGNTGGVPNPINASHTAVPAGQSSAGMGGATPNGHKWGSSTGPSNGSTFGNNQGMDTWTFAKGATYSNTFDVTIKEADLAITSLSADKSNNIYVGDEITYTVKVKNNGNPNYSFEVINAPFHFVVPEGLEPITGTFYTFDGNSCGVETGGNNLSFDDTSNTFKSKLNLPKDCEVTYTIKVKVNDKATAGTGEVKAGILRPADVYDPDGTNTSDPENPLGDLYAEIDMENFFYPPFDPFIEAEYNGNDGESNNVAKKDVKVKTKSDLAIVKSSNPETVTVGDDVTFILTVTNNGPHDAIGVVVTDEVPNGYTNITSISDGGTISNGVITWEIDELENDESFDLTFKATVKGEGEHNNVASVSSYDPNSFDPVEENNEDSHNPVKPNTTNAVDDFFEGDVNETIEGNLLYNDYDLQGHTQTATAGPFTTEKGGTIEINADGSFTYTPPTDFDGRDSYTYTVLDEKGATDTAEVVFDVGVCTVEVEGVDIIVPYQIYDNGTLITREVIQPDVDYGYVIDIYELDNSFNIEFNGINIASQEIQFQEFGVPAEVNLPMNVMFADGDKYEYNINGTWIDRIYELEGDKVNNKPIIRVIISPTGNVQLLGSKVSADHGDYKLQPLILYNGNVFNQVVFNPSGNFLKVTQIAVGETLMTAYGYGRTTCESMPVAINDYVSTPVDTPVSGNILTNDDGEEIKVSGLKDVGGEPIELDTPTLIKGKDGSDAGTITIKEDGTFTFTPEPGFTGEVPIDYEIKDTRGLSDQAQLVINVIPAVNPTKNNPPIAVDDNFKGPKGEKIEGNIIVNDFDPDNDPIKVTEIVVDGGTTVEVTATTPGTITIPGVGEITVNEDGDFTFEPEDDFFSDVPPITYTVCDNGDAVECDDENVNITIFYKDESENAVYA